MHFAFFEGFLVTYNSTFLIISILYPFSRLKYSKKKSFSEFWYWIYTAARSILFSNIDAALNWTSLHPYWSWFVQKIYKPLNIVLYVTELRKDTDLDCTEFLDIHTFHKRQTYEQQLTKHIYVHLKPGSMIYYIYIYKQTHKAFKKIKKCS